MPYCAKHNATGDLILATLAESTSGAIEIWQQLSGKVRDNKVVARWSIVEVEIVEKPVDRATEE